MQTAWFMTMFIFTVVFFIIFFTVYFFRPRKDDRIIPERPERAPLDPEHIALPHRVEPGWPATIETAAGETAEARIASIAQGSGFVESPISLAIGEKFRLTIHPPGRPPLQLMAEVTWSNLHLPPEKVLNRGMGIRFIEAGEEAVSLINETVALHGAARKSREEQVPSA